MHAPLRLALAASLALHPVHAQEPAAPQQPQSGERPKIGLVLAGGGALGCAHAGVIQVLEELRIPIDYVVGTSMGAIVGASYAYGMSPEQMRRELNKDNWDYLLADDPLRDDLSFRRKEDELSFLFDFSFGFDPWNFEFKLPKGLLQGQFLDLVFNRLVIDSYKHPHFDQLNIPFRAVASDISNGEAVVLDSGSLPRAMRASMSVPGAFSPVKIDGRDLVDGGIVNNLPVDVVREMGADVVIAVSIVSPLKDADELGSLFGVTGQMISLLIKQNEDRSIASLTSEDQLILLDLDDMTAMDFDRSVPAMAIGEQTARGLIDQLRRYSVDEATFEAWKKGQRRAPWQPPVLGGIDLENNSGIGDKVVLSQLDLEPGERLDLDRLERSIAEVYGRLEFRLVGYRLEERAGAVWLILKAERKEWGPGYIRFGLQIADDLDGDSNYNLGFQYVLRELNDLGGEIRSSFGIGSQTLARSEWFQPLTYSRGGPFLAPSLQYDRTNPTAFQMGNQIGEFRAETFALAFAGGYQFDNWGELRFGIDRSFGEVDPRIVSSPVPGFTFDDSSLFARFRIDTLDEVAFPHDGAFFVAEFESHEEELGADVEFQTFGVGGAFAYPATERLTFVAVGNYDTSVQGTRPLYEQATLGGFLNLSGTSENQLGAQHVLFGGLVSYYQLSGKRGSLLGFPVYVGGSIETGAFQTERDDLLDELLVAGSLFTGVDTPIGPVNLGYGMAEGSEDSVYLFVGNYLTGR